MGAAVVRDRTPGSSWFVPRPVAIELSRRTWPRQRDSHIGPAVARPDAVLPRWTSGSPSGFLPRRGFSAAPERDTPAIGSANPEHSGTAAGMFATARFTAETIAIASPIRTRLGTFVSRRSGSAFGEPAPAAAPPSIRRVRSGVVNTVRKGGSAFPGIVRKGPFFNEGRSIEYGA
ncbi:hypothetical protein DMC64_12645 [Amycolatopsis sp. WAC 04197]|nr:hypothetical protein DMC64_12645 [Amycolatopsis sp. WAC 04197]